MNLDHVLRVMLFAYLEANIHSSENNNRSRRATVWAGDVDFQRATAGVTNCDVQLHVFQKTNDIIFSLTTFHVEIDLQRMTGAEFSKKFHASKILSSCFSSTAYCDWNLTGSISQMLCFGTVTQCLAASVNAAAFNKPNPKRLLT